MKFKLSTSGIAGNIRQLVALLGIAESATNAIALPGNIRSVMLASSTLLLAVEHFLDGFGNTTHSAAPAEAAAPVVTIAPEVLAAAQQIVAAATAAGIVATGSPTAAGQA